MVDVVTGEPSADISKLIEAWGDGDDEALQPLVSAVYPELRRMARRQLGRRAAGHSLESAAWAMRPISSCFAPEASGAKAACTSSRSVRKSSGAFSWIMREAVVTPSVGEMRYASRWMTPSWRRSLEELKSWLLTRRWSRWPNSTRARAGSSNCATLAD